MLVYNDVCKGIPVCSKANYHFQSKKGRAKYELNWKSLVTLIISKDIRDLSVMWF